jgi:hypothetical protein
MRIVIVGDMQYSQNEGLKVIESAFQNINTLWPDVISFLGDYGDYASIGSTDNIRCIAEASKILDAEKVYPILGNHDLELETGKNEYSHGTIENAFMEAYHLDETNYVVEYDDFRLFFCGDEPVPEQIVYDFYHRHDNYTSPESFKILQERLDKRPNIPVVMFTHAQPIGGGLKTVPDCHVRASNAYLNQNRQPEKWLGIIKQNPQIVMWFCGHYHLGQHYKNSMSSRYGVDFYLTGVVTGARDEARHSRVLDISKDNVCVSTYDHKAKKLICDKNYGCSISHIKSNYDEGTIYPVDFEEGHGKILKLLHCPPNKVYLLTDTGFVWEVDSTPSSVTGTLNCSCVVGTLNYSKSFTPIDIFMKDGLVWCSDGMAMRGFNPENPNRFMREYDELAEYVELSL